MYGRIQKHSSKRLFATAQDAYRLMAHYYLHISGDGGCILDYLLLPHSIDILISYKRTQENIICIERKSLLSVFGALAYLGKQYPFSGTYELYHASHCFCELGKAGTHILPFPLETILQTKRKAMLRGSSPCLF